MMFQGSEHADNQEHMKIITQAGGVFNGTTNRDRTNYYQTIPSNQLEKILWLEADRMGFLLDAVSQEKFEIQRATIKNEKAQNYDNKPYGLIWEKLGEALYPASHPYSWQTIGYVEDLDRVNVYDLKAFFLQWYVPNNAVLTIGGDIDTIQTLTWINKYFGTIPAREDIAKHDLALQELKQPMLLEQDKFITLEDQIKQPMVLIAWHTTYAGEKHEIALDMLANVLGNGNNSILYQDLVKTKKALQVSASHNCGELACSFYIYALADSNSVLSDHSLNSLYQDILASLNKFQQQGVSKKRLAQIVGKAKSSTIFGMQSIASRIKYLAHNETFFQTPDLLARDLEQLEQITPVMLQDVYQQFIADKNSVTLSVVPKNMPHLAVKPANFVPLPRVFLGDLKTTNHSFNYTKAVDNFDRTKVPTQGKTPQINIPDTYSYTFANNSKLLGSVMNTQNTSMIKFSLPAGDRYVAHDQAGLAKLTAQMIMQDSNNYSREEVRAKLDILGSNIVVAAGEYTVDIIVSTLTENLAPTLDILQEMLLQPAFNLDDFVRIKKHTLESIMQKEQSLSSLATKATKKVLYQDSAFAKSTTGSLASVDSLTLQDVQTFYQKHYTSQHAQIVVVSNLSANQIKIQLKFWENWHAAAAPLYAPEVIEPLTTQNIYLVDKPNASQSYIVFARHAMTYSPLGEYYLASLANFNLAGNFNSRINQNIREDKGYTYGANAAINGNNEVGNIIFKTQVKSSVTKEAILEIEKELQQFSKHGITMQELEFMRSSLLHKEALKYETPLQILNLLSHALQYGLSLDYLTQRNNLVTNINLQTLNNIANQWFKPDDFQIIVVGDLNILKPELEKLNKNIEVISFE